jgi:hypothetical protein
LFSRLSSVTVDAAKTECEHGTEYETSARSPVSPMSERRHIIIRISTYPCDSAGDKQFYNHAHARRDGDELIVIARGSLGLFRPGTPTVLVASALMAACNKPTTHDVRALAGTCASVLSAVVAHVTIHGLQTVTAGWSARWLAGVAVQPTEDPHD